MALRILPTGTILAYGGSAAPTGYLMCDGTAVSRTTYAELFRLLSTAFGAGDGSTTFNLPDLRQRFPLGKAASGTGSTLGGTGGAIDHIHNVNVPSTTSGAPSGTLGVTVGASNVASAAHTHDTDPASAASDGNNPPYQVVNYIIRT